MKGNSKGATDVHYITGLPNAFEFFFAAMAVMLSSYTTGRSTAGEEYVITLRNFIQCHPPTVRLFQAGDLPLLFRHLLQ